MRGLILLHRALACASVQEIRNAVTGQRSKKLITLERCKPANSISCRRLSNRLGLPGSLPIHWRVCRHAVSLRTWSRASVGTVSGFQLGMTHARIPWYAFGYSAIVIASLTFIVIGHSAFWDQIARAILF